MNGSRSRTKRAVPVAALCLSLLGAASTASALSPEEKETRIQIKRQVFGGMMFQRAEQVAAGQAQPLMGFEARDSFFVNWVIPGRNVDKFEAALGLPQGTHLSPIQVLEGERPRYYLSLNMYEVTIGSPMFRGDWSVYVTVGDDPTPRFMVIQAEASATTLDPVFVTKPAASIDYLRGAGVREARIEAPGTKFALRFDEPRRTRSNTRFATPEWTGIANDYINWMSGVFDKAYYDSTSTEAQVTLVDPRSVELVHETPWAAFVRPTPEHVVLFNTPLAIAVSPWANLSDPNLPLDPALRAALQGAKANAFGGLGQLDAYQAYTGAAEPLAEFQTDTSVPAYFVNFRVPYNKVHALADAIGLPEGFNLAPMRALDGERREFMLSLNVYKASGAGLRAEWSVYVTNEEDPFNAYFMKIDVATDTPFLDVVNLGTPPAQLFTHGVADGLTHTSIIANGGTFDLSFAVPNARARSGAISRDWIRANEKVYSTNGVYDRVLFNGTLFNADIAIADPCSVHLANGTRWAQFVDAEPLEVLVFRNALEFKVRPWFNIEEIEPVLP